MKNTNMEMSIKMSNIENLSNKKLTTQQVARILGKSDEFVRVRFTTSDYFHLD